MMPDIKGRYAPSPTGRMHLGNVFCALVSWLSAKSRGGKWVLRIEDLDAGRCRREYADLLMDDLEFLGLYWDEGPFWQSERHDLYREALDTLAKGGHTYPCWCTRAELGASSAPHESDGRRIYPGTCRDNPARARLMCGRPASIRLRVPSEEIRFEDLHYGPQCVNLERQCGDFVLRRSDGAWAYQLAVVVDDALMGINQVVRGRDLLLSAAQQTCLYSLLGWTAPQFAHIPLICNASGQRLSKRDASLDMASLRSRHSAEEIIGYLARLCGLVPGNFDAITPSQLLDVFRWSALPLENIKIFANFEG